MFVPLRGGEHLLHALLGGHEDGEVLHADGDLGVALQVILVKVLYEFHGLLDGVPVLLVPAVVDPAAVLPTGDRPLPFARQGIDRL